MAARIRTARSEAARMVEFDYGEAGSTLLPFAQACSWSCCASWVIDVGCICLPQWW
jgi:hypothetical protein